MSKPGSLGTQTPRSRFAANSERTKVGATARNFGSATSRRVPNSGASMVALSHLTSIALSPSRSGQRNRPIASVRWPQSSSLIDVRRSLSKQATILVESIGFRPVEKRELSVSARAQLQARSRSEALWKSRTSTKILRRGAWSFTRRPYFNLQGGSANAWALRTWPVHLRNHMAPPTPFVRVHPGGESPPTPPPSG